jgi:hypothetical protein
MPGTAIGKQMNLGYPGSYSRNGDCQIMARPVYGSDTNGPNFGDPLVVNSDSTGGTYSSVADLYLRAGTLAMTNFAGVAVREVKTFETYTAASLGGYAPGLMCDCITRGSVNVVVTNGTPQAHGAVWVRTVVGSLQTPVGGFECAIASDGGTCVQITNAEFTTGVTSTDANGNVIAEITLINKSAA